MSNGAALPPGDRVTRRPRNIAAIPTVYRDIKFRSRLEVKWAALMDLCSWNWSYEALDITSAKGVTRIPDFLMHWHTPVIIECKPAVSIDEVTELRRELIAVVMPWLTKGAEDELRALDKAPDNAGDLARADECVAYVDDLRDRGDAHLWYRGRRALVVGARLFEFRECYALPVPRALEDTFGVGLSSPPDGVTIDGWHYLTRCDGHVGLHNQRECLVCGLEGPGEVLASARVHEAWAAASNAAQWRPPAVRV